MSSRIEVDPTCGASADIADTSEDAALLKQLQAEVLSDVEPLPGADTLHDLPVLRRSSGTTYVTGRSAPGVSAGSSAVLPLTRHHPVPVATPFTLTGMEIVRSTSPGRQGDLQRKAYAIFEAAVDDFHAGRVGAAHTNAMLARLYDPECMAYAHAVSSWGALLRKSRTAPSLPEPDTEVA